MQMDFWTRRVGLKTQSNLNVYRQQGNHCVKASVNIISSLRSFFPGSEEFFSGLKNKENPTNDCVQGEKKMRWGVVGKQ